MAFEEGASTLTCRDCGAEHRAEWYRSPWRDEQKLRCIACKGSLFNGKDVHVYTDVRLIKKS